MTQIQVRQESFAIDYQGQSLPALFSQQSSDCDFASSGILDFVGSDELVSVINKARQTMLLACNQLKEEEVITALMNKADSGVQIYLLLGDKKQNQTAIDQLSGRCLVRSGVSQQGALVLVDHTRIQPQGLLLMGHQALTTSENKSWMISLESQQIDDSYRSFCKLFWENADSEYLQQNQSQQKVSHPDGNIVTNHSHQLCGTLKDCLDDTLNSLVRVSHSAFGVEGDSYRLLLASNASNIEQVARQGVALTDSHIPTLLMSTDGSWLLPDKPDFSSVNWCLKLSGDQSKQLQASYDVAMEEATWQYMPKVSMAELPNNQKLRFADQPDLVRIVEQGRSNTLTAIDTDTIDSFLTDSAESLAKSVTGWQPDFMAHQIEYQVAIHPPYCPSSAKKDLLYADWEKSEENWQDRLSVLERQQKSIDEKQDGLADRLRGFIKGFLLGQGQSVKRLNQELGSLQNWSVTEATPAERAGNTKRLEDLQAKIKQRGNDTVEKLDEAAQNQLWEEKRKALLKSLQEKTAISNDNVKKQDIALSEKKSRQQQADSDFLLAWKEAVKSIPNKKMNDTKVNDLAPEQFLADVLPDNEDEKKVILEAAKAECASKKREIICSMTLEQIDQWKNTFKDKVWTKHYSDLSKALKNRNSSLQKIERDNKDANSSVLDAQLAQDQAQASIEAHGVSFVYQPKKDNKAFDQQLGLKAKAVYSDIFSWPDEELPAASTELRSLNNQRFLVIVDDEYLDQARTDALRLSANIVCDKENMNA